MYVRPATVADAEAIRQIYNVEVSHSTVTFDLVERSLLDQQRWLTERQGALTALVAIDDDPDGFQAASGTAPDASTGHEGGGIVVGFASISPYRDRPAYSTTVEDSVYIHRDHHGRGLGSLLLGALVTAASEHGFHAMMARIVGGHEASIRLHERHGFASVGVEREVGRKFGRWLDVVIMQRLLDT